MTVSYAQFIDNFPEFANAGAYPESSFDFWYGIAGNVVNPRRWGALTDTGAQLYVGHNLALEAQAAKSAATGAVPGFTTGPVASKSIDKISIAYAVAEAIEEGGGQFNLTTYGTRFFGMLMMMGSGGLQL